MIKGKKKKKNFEGKGKKMLLRSNFSFPSMSSIIVIVQTSDSYYGNFQIPLYYKFCIIVDNSDLEGYGLTVKEGYQHFNSKEILFHQLVVYMGKYLSKKGIFADLSLLRQIFPHIYHKLIK